MMPIRMPMMLRHALARTRAVLTSPADLVLLLLAALGSMFAWIMVSMPVVSRLSNTPFGYAVLAVVTLTLYLWSWLLAIPLSGGRARGGQQWHRAMPMSSLPIGFRSRVLAEAAAGLVLVLLIRAATGAGLISVDWSNTPGHELVRTSVVPFILYPGLSLAAPLLALPVLLAWLAPARDETTFVGRPLLVAILAVSGSLIPIPAVEWLRVSLISFGLSALVLLGFVRVGAGGGTSAPFSGSLARSAMAPEGRLQRDRWQRLLRPLALFVGSGLLLLFGGLLLRSQGVLPGAAHALCALVAFGLLARVWALPLGISVFATDALASSTSLFGGAFGRAWTTYPVRPETLRRSVYLHGLATAALVGLSFTAHSLLAEALDLRWWTWRDDLVLLIAAPCAAGFLLCAAVGDRWRGTLSAVGMLSLLPAHVVLLADFSDTLQPAIHLAVLLALAVLGGIPPLTHLRGSGAAVQRTVPEAA